MCNVTVNFNAKVVQDSVVFAVLEIAVNVVRGIPFALTSEDSGYAKTTINTVTHEINLLSTGDAPLSWIAEYAALHILAAIPNGLILERIEDDWEGRAKTVIPHPVSKDGHLDVPNAPGLGVDIDEDFVKQWPSEMNVSVPVSETSGAYAEGTFGEHVYVQTRRKRGVYFKGK